MTRKTILRSIIITLIFVFLSAGAAFAQGIAYTVDSTGDGGNVPPNGTICNDGTGHCTLRAAIQASNAHAGDDGIFFDLPAGSVINLGTALPNLSTNINISGPGANLLSVQRSTANGTPEFRIFNISNISNGTLSVLTVTISGLTIANGFVNNSQQGNSSNFGGGILNEHGTLAVENCTLSGNFAQFGGGIYNNGDGGYPGQPAQAHATLTITNSTFSGNSTNTAGGAIFSDGEVGNNGQAGLATLNILNSTFSQNSGPYGGGIYNDGTISGGISGHALLSITNSTFNQNSGPVAGGGIYNDASNGLGGPGGSATFKIRNTILNKGGQAGQNIYNNFGTVTSLGYNLSSDSGGGFLTATGDQINTDPLLDPAGLKDNGGPTKTIALLFGSPAIDKGSNSVLTVLTSAINNSTTAINVTDASNISAGVGYTILIDSEQMVVTSKAGNTLSVTRGANGTTATSHSAGASLYAAFDQRGTGFQRTFDNPAIPPAAGGDNTDIGAFERGAKTPFDFDGDGKTDLSVFRPSTGAWYLQQSTAGLYGILFGFSTDKITPADFDGDGKTDIAVYRSSTGIWYVLNSGNGTVSYTNFGLAEDLPTPADYDGDGKADIAVFRPSTSTWYRQNSSDGSFYAIQFGSSGDKPTVGDFDGDGKADIAIFRPSVGAWYHINSSNGSLFGEQFGFGTDIIVPADYDGDGKTDLAVFRPSNGFWYIKNSATSTYTAYPFGLSADIPAPGDFDGDGKADLSVFRPSDGNWYRLNSSNGTFASFPFGTSGDKPTQTAFRY